MKVLVNPQGEIQKIVSSVDYEDLTDLTVIECQIPNDYPIFSQWDPTNLCFVIDLSSHKNHKWAQVKTRREQAETGGCSTAFGRIDTDEMSILRINSGVLAAKLSLDQQVPFTIDWTMADNSVVTLDAPQMISLGLAAMLHVVACHERGRHLRQAIYDSSSLEELESVYIESGWPQ